MRQLARCHNRGLAKSSYRASLRISSRYSRQDRELFRDEVQRPRIIRLKAIDVLSRLHANAAASFIRTGVTAAKTDDWRLNLTNS